jgi:hypothetical protein
LRIAFLVVRIDHAFIELLFGFVFRLLEALG